MGAEPGSIAYTRISWTRCQNRCHNTNDPDYERYGARGIIVCDRWRESFLAFLQDMGPRPPGQTLDRIDSLGNYEPGNCRWATAKTQNRHAIHYVTYNGKTQSVQEWADEVGLKQTTLSARLKRLSVEEALTRPLAK